MRLFRFLFLRIGRLLIGLPFIPNCKRGTCVARFIMRICKCFNIRFIALSRMHLQYLPCGHSKARAGIILSTFFFRLQLRYGKVRAGVRLYDMVLAFGCRRCENPKLQANAKKADLVRSSHRSARAAEELVTSSIARASCPANV